MHIEGLDVTERLTKDPRRLAVWTGIIGPILFVSVFTIEGFLRSGYDPIAMYISDLSWGPRGFIQISNFIVFGTLLIVFAHGVTNEFRERNLSLVGPRILTFMGLLLILSGPLVTDPANIPFSEMTWHGIIHNILGACFFLFGPISCYVFWRSFRTNAEWDSMKGLTLVVGVILAVTVTVFSVAQKSALLIPNALTAWAGAIQRFDLITFMCWIVIFAWVLNKRLD